MLCLMCGASIEEGGLGRPGKAKVLCIDDDELLLGIFAHFLQDSTFETLVADLPPGHLGTGGSRLTSCSLGIAGPEYLTGSDHPGDAGLPVERRRSVSET